MTRRALAVALAVALLAPAACIRRGGEASAPSASWRTWPAARDQARRLAAGGAYARADSVLVAFDERWGGAPEGEEARYWRALLALDPSNTQSTPADAVALIDRYLASAPAGARRAEMEMLRRTATAMQALAAASQEAKSAQQADARARADELQKLKDDLAKAQAELERVRKRVIRRAP